MAQLKYSNSSISSSSSSSSGSKDTPPKKIERGKTSYQSTRSGAGEAGFRYSMVDHSIIAYIILYHIISCYIRVYYIV